MMVFIRNPKKVSGGFTIVELLIVVVVIAILAAITIVSYGNITQRAKNSAAMSAASTAGKKLAMAVIELGGAPSDKASLLTHSGLVEATGAGAGITNGTTYQYSAMSSGGYCLTVTTGGISYKVTDTNATPEKGACSGHGSNGVAAITNYLMDPKPTYPNYWDGSNTGSGVTNVSSSWSASGRANRVIFPAALSYPDAGGLLVTLQPSYLPYAGQKFTIAVSARIVSGTGTIAGSSIDRTNSAIGTVHYYASSGSTPLSSTAQTYKTWITFSADAAASAPGNGLRLYLPIRGKTANTVVEFADYDLYPGDYQPNRKWASGDSSGWVWNGAPDNSTSTGTPL